MSGTCTCGCGGRDERHAADALYNPPGRTALDYRVGEYGSLFAAMIDRLASPAYPALRGLTVRSTDDPAVALLDACAVLGDVLTFHLERIADEGYLRTAKETQSLARLGRLVGHRPRPGVAADVHLAYTVDRDPRAEDVPVLIPRGARSHSVPAASNEPPQTFETGVDLVARWAWNELTVRRRRPALLTPEDLRQRSELFVAGTANSLQVGDTLLADFGTQRMLMHIAEVRIDRADDVTAIRLPQAAPPSLAELVAELRQWITAPATPGPGEPTPETPNPRPVSKLVQDFDIQVLAPLRADLDTIRTPAEFVRRLAEPLDRLAEAQALAEPYEDVAAWFEQLAAMIAELAECAADLEPARPEPPAPTTTQAGSAAAQALGTLLPALRNRVVRAASGGGPDHGDLFAPGSDLAAQLMSTLDPRLAGSLYPAWRRTASPVPAALRELAVMRVKAAPFGATAPLRPVQDDRGRVVQQVDWPLPGAELTSMRVVFDSAGAVPVRAEFQHTAFGGSAQHSENLPGETSFDLGTGRVELSASSASRDRAVDSVTARLLPGLPARTLIVSRPGADGRVQVVVHNGEALEWRLARGEHQQVTHGEYQVTVRFTTATEPAAVHIGIVTVPEPATRFVLPLDTVHDGITVGSWVTIDRPRKGSGGPDGIPGSQLLALVTTHVTAVRTVAYTNYGITGRGTELTLAHPWLDEHDVLLSAIRDTTVHARGEALRLADEPLGEDVHGNTLELAELYDGLRPGRRLIVSGTRSDIPGTTGVQGSELAVIAAVDQHLDPAVPGDHVHTVLTLTTDLVHRYRRETVRVQGNVVPATHGESRDEPIGSGDAARANQTFTLWQSPLTWLPDDNPVGATPTLEIRVDGLLWHGVNSLAGRGPRERVYVIGTTGDGRTTVTFGDGTHGARLPTGHDNVRARYRFGTGKAANVEANRITQAITRPLGVAAVTNPQPATGGADADGPDLTRRTIPLSVTALDRLVSISDYEDFARSRAGIGRATARELYDGRRKVLHVTVAGVDDVPIADDAEVLRTLRSSLAEYGDARLPVHVDVRELVLLLLVAKVKVAPDYAWQLVEPQLRAALLRDLGYHGRELGQPARISEVLATAHTVPGVDYVDVDTFTGIPASITADELARLADKLGEPSATVPARLAEYHEDRYRVTALIGETLTEVASRNGLSLSELVRLNPDITGTGRLPRGRSVLVFRGIRPAQLALFSPELADTLILTEVK